MDKQVSRKGHIFFIACAALAALLSLFPPARAQEPARRADDFVDSIGVATHWGYADTPYGFAYEKVKALLGASQIRHVRDGFHPRLRDLHDAFGIRATVLFNPGDAAGVAQTVRENRDLIAMVEGPNEVDLFPKSAAYENLGFPEGPRRWMPDLRAALKANPATSSVPVIAPSTARPDSNARLAPLAAFDCVVMHSYAGGQMPSRSLTSDINNNLTNAWRILGPGSVLKPIVVTESGYHTALGSSVVLAGAQPGVSEAAQAKYLPRHFAEYWNAGIVRTFTYEFIDEFPDYDRDERTATNAEACFGIVKRDGTPKPAYHTIKNLLALLSESRWDASAKRWIRSSPDFRPGALAFTLSGDTKNVHHTLLQKADGDFYLLLWQEVPSFDLVRRENIANADAKITLTLAHPASVVLDTLDAPPPLLQGIERDTKRIALSVPDAVIVVRVIPEKTPAATAAVPPRAPKSVTTATEATLSWLPPPGPKPAGYFVRRMGAFIGRTTQPTFRDAGLLPGAGYTYALAAFDAAGRVSPPISLVAQTRSAFPDLVVSEVTWEGGAPQPNRPLRFSALIRNVGSAPTPAGVVHGVAFSVDNKVVCWSDTFRGPLKPGESRTVSANNGPNGNALWTPTAGNHEITATVDDVRRIAESDDSNNTRQKSVRVPEL